MIVSGSAPAITLSTYELANLSGNSVTVIQGSTSYALTTLQHRCAGLSHRRDHSNGFQLSERNRLAYLDSYASAKWLGLFRFSTAFELGFLRNATGGVTAWSEHHEYHVNHELRRRRFSTDDPIRRHCQRQRIRAIRIRSARLVD